MVVGEMPEGVDLLVVGGGPGGYVAALAAAQHGRSVVLVDAQGSNGLGGVCVTVGCIPSKALIELANEVHTRAAWNDRGLPGSKPEVDMTAFQSWKSGVVGGLSGGVHSLLKAAGVDVRTGHFRFTRKDQGAVETLDGPPTHLQFQSCILATGSRPVQLDGLTRDGIRVLDSTDVLELRELPSSAAVVGGGYIGIELGTALAKVGVSVSIIEAAPTLLPGMGKRAGDAVARRLRALGVKALTSTTTIGDDGTNLHVSGPQGEQTLPVDAVIVAVGRRPNTDDVGLSALGVVPDERGILPVGSDLLLTPTIAAIGDITPGPALAHKASAEAHVAADVLCGKPATFTPRTISAVVFSDPEVAVTGMSESEATEAGYTPARATFPISASGRARTMAEDVGAMHWVYDRPTGVLLGAEIIGPHATDLISEAALAIEMTANLEDVAHTIHPHPTMSETLSEAAMVGLGHPVHIPRRS